MDRLTGGDTTPLGSEKPASASASAVFTASNGRPVPGYQARPRRRPRQLPLPVLFLLRSGRIVVFSVAFAAAFGAHRLVSPSSGPRLLRWYLQSTGAAFVKLGQILAMRYDLLPVRYCEELSKLLDSLPPVPYDALVEVIERDLEIPIEDCFSELETQAIATASIAQVHGARLHNGQRVIVKVIRPGIARHFRVDFVYMRLGARVLDAYGPLADMDVRRLVRELIALTREELDFRREARNIWEMHEAMLDDDVDHYTPALVPELCGRHVLTMERIDGVSVVAILTALDSSDHESLARWAQMGIEPERTASLLMRSILEQSMRHRIFHTDPHAGNLIVMEGGTLAWVDFGMLGWLDERLWEGQFGMREAVAAGDVYRAYQHLLSTLEPLPPIDLSGFQAEVTELFRDWVVASKAPTASLLEKSSGFVFLRIFDAVRRAGLTLPVGLSRLYRAIFVGDIVMLKLDPAIDWVPIMRRFVSDELLRLSLARLTDLTSPATLNATVRAYTEAPRAMAALGESIMLGRRSVQPGHRSERDRLGRVVALALSYARTAVLVATLTLIGSRTIAPVLFAQTSWDDLDGRLNSPTLWWLMVTSGLVGTVILGRLIHELRRSR